MVSSGQHDRFRDGERFDRQAAADAWRAGAQEAGQSRPAAGVADGIEAAPAGSSQEPPIAPKIEPSYPELPDSFAPGTTQAEAKPWEPTPQFLRAAEAVNIAWLADMVAVSVHDKDLGQGFLQSLNKQGYIVAQVSPQEAAISKVEHESAKARGEYAAEFKAGEFVMVAQEGQTYRLGYGLCKENTREINEALELMGPGFLPTRNEARAMQREARNHGMSYGNGGPEQTVEQDPSVLAGAAFASVSEKLADIVSSLFTVGDWSPANPVKTPEQVDYEQRGAMQAERKKDLRELQAGEGDHSSRSDHGNATTEDLSNRASGSGDAAVALARRYMEEQQRREGGWER